MNHGNGFVLTRIEETKIIQNYTKLIHFINLTEYEDNINVIKQTISSLTFEIPNSLKFKLQHLEDMYQTIIPHTVQKRGLLNIVGHALKFLTGTMDNNDAEDIAKHFSALEQNEHNLIFNSNSQIKINEKLSKNLNIITEHINTEQNVTVNKINQLQLNVNSLEREIYKNNIIRDITENMETLSNHMKNIKETIMLSRLEILSRDILSSKEIEENGITLEKSKYLKLSVATYNEALLFIISIPNFSNNKFYKVHIEPMPNKNKLQLISPYESVLTSNKEIYEMPNKNENEIRYLKSVTDQCISNIFNNKRMHCSYEDNYNEEIKQITSNILVTKNLNQTKLVNTCHQPYEIFISQNNIIKFENCKLQIKNIKFENKIMKYYEHVILPNTVKEIEVRTPNKFSLEEIHKSNIDNLREIEEVKYQSNKNSWFSISADIVIIVIIIILMILYFKPNVGSKLKVNVQTLPMTRQESSPKEDGVTYAFK